MAVAFGLFGLGLWRDRYRQVESRLDVGEWPGFVNAVRAYVTNDGDVRRYFAYAAASRSRPYPSYFVRTADDWRKSFAAAEPYRPDAWPTLDPKQPLVPYRDYLVEYPPGFFLVALPPAWIASDADSYVKWFAAWMALLLTVALYLTTKAVERLEGRQISLASTLVWAALGVLLLGVGSPQAWPRPYRAGLPQFQRSLAHRQTRISYPIWANNEVRAAQAMGTDWLVSNVRMWRDL